MFYLTKNVRIRADYWNKCKDDKKKRLSGTHTPEMKVMYYTELIGFEVSVSEQNVRTPLHFTVFPAAPCHLEGRKLASFGFMCHMSCAVIGQYFTPAGTSPILSGCGSKNHSSNQLKWGRWLHKSWGFLSIVCLNTWRTYVVCRLNKRECPKPSP